MLIEFDLSNNDAEALLRHCSEHQPGTDDFRENARLREALQALAAAINDAMRPENAAPVSNQSIEPQLLEAAIELFGDQTLAVQWLSRPIRALGNKRPMDMLTVDALELIARLKHGIVT